MVAGICIWLVLAMTAAASALPARTTMTGCLAGGGSRSAGAPSRAPTPTATGVSVFATADGIEIRHALSHACCLKGTVAVERRARALTMTERLTGTPCRCLCQSEITSAVAIAPGRYHLVVRSAQKGEPAAFDGTIDVPRTSVRVTLVAPQASPAPAPAPAPPWPVPPLPRRPVVPAPVETY